MIQFYNKYILFFLPLSLLPLILHLLFYKKTTEINFTYTNLIEKILKQNFPRKKIIDIIILILRCLIILLLILFFARPVMYLSLSEAKVNLVVGIDTSCSTRHRVLNTIKFNILKEKLKDLLRFLNDKNIKVKLISFDESVNVLNNMFEIPSEQLIEKVDMLKPSYKCTNVDAVLTYLYSNDYGLDINNSYFNKVIIFTDLAEHIIDKNRLVIENVNKNIKEILFCYPEVDLTNLGIEDLYIEKDEDLISINCRYFVSKNDIKNFAMKLFINFQQVDVVNVDAKKNKFKFNYPIDENFNDKFLVGKIVLPTDSLIEDNNFYFVYNNRIDDKEILCLVNEPSYYRGFKSKQFYFEKLPLPKLNIVPLDNNIENKVLNFQYENKDLIIVGAEKLSDFEKYLYLQENKIVIFPGENIEYENFEKFLKDIEVIEIQKNNLNFYTFTLGEDAEFNEYIKKFEYANIWVKYKFFITTLKNSDWIVLLKFNDGTPALLKKKNIFLFTFPLNQDFTNFLHKPIFVGLMKYFFFTEQKDKYRNYYFVSEPINFEDKIEKIKSYTEENFSENFYDYKKDKIIFNNPGVYEMINNKENFYIAVNIKPQEGRVSLIDKDKLKNYFKNLGVNIYFLDIQKNSYLKDISQWCLGKEYSQNILYILILLFIIETLLSRIIYKRLI